MNYYKKQKNHAFKVVFLSTVIVVAFVAYDFFIASATQPLSAQTDSQSTREQLLSVFGRIQSLKIDTSITTNQTFMSLQDFTVTPDAQQIGKSNPFAAGQAVTTPAPKTTKTKGR